MTGGVGFGQDPPYQIEPGASVSSYALMDNVLANAKERKGDTFFTRDWPWLGRRKTAVWGYAYTADGHTVHVRAEKALVDALAKSEQALLIVNEAPEGD
jgi:hypothetical protein